MDVHGKRQPESLVCQNPKTFLQTGRYASKTIRMQKESLRETNFEATVTRFEFPRRKVLDPGGAQQNFTARARGVCSAASAPRRLLAALRAAPPPPAEVRVDNPNLFRGVASRVILFFESPPPAEVRVDNPNLFRGVASRVILFFEPPPRTGRPWQTPTGELGLSGSKNVFADG